MNKTTITIPAWMIPAECAIRSRKYGSSRLAVLMNTTRAEKPVMYSIDGEDWESTPFQTANFRHTLDQAAVRQVWDWLGDIAG